MQYKFVDILQFSLANYVDLFLSCVSLSTFRSSL